MRKSPSRWRTPFTGFAVPKDRVSRRVAKSYSECDEADWAKRAFSSLITIDVPSSLLLFCLMQPARQILEIVRSHMDGDDERFRTAALQLAANEARQGHTELARKIQQLVVDARRVSEPSGDQGSNSVIFGRPQGELAGLLEMVQPAFGLGQLVLPAPLERRLRRVLKEQRSSADFENTVSLLEGESYSWGRQAAERL